MANAVGAAPAEQGLHQEVVDVWENERYYPLKGWTKSLLPADPSPYLSRGETKSYASLAQVAPRQDWSWATEWSVAMASMPHDADGWQYGVSFNLPLGGWTAKNGWADVVRRRLWSRVQRPTF
jgi:tectonin beta-propeller repeat-containing protein 1